MKQAKISVIIPVYKVEKYLDRCVESVVNQTYQNLEIILVDDGSPDNCPKMCDEWAKKDKRIKVIHKENGGVSAARNDGIKAATGEYIAFIDSDDYIFENFSEFLNYAVDQNVDVVVSNLFDKNAFNVNLKYDAVNEKDLVKLIKQKIIMSCYGKLIKKEFLINNNLNLYKGIYGEDFEWSMRTYLKIKSLAIWANKFYHYEFTDASVSLRMKYKHIASLVENTNHIFNSINESSIGNKSKKTLKALSIQNLYYNLLCSLQFSEEEMVKILKLIKENKHILVYPYGLKCKFWCFIIKLFGVKMASKIYFLLHLSYGKDKNNK